MVCSPSGVRLRCICRQNVFDDKFDLRDDSELLTSSGLLERVGSTGIHLSPNILYVGSHLYQFLISEPLAWH